MSRTIHRNLSAIPALTLLMLAVLTGCAFWEGDTEEVVFNGGGNIDLYGTLVFPDSTQELLPVIVMLHGAERATRDRFIYRITGNLFLERGLAVLTYDKRGAGQSGGDYENTTYEQLIQDAVAAIAYLRNRSDIDPNRIGIFGVSESGWLAPEIIERSGDIAFLINKVGSTLSVRATVAWEMFNDLQADGIDADSAREQTDIILRIWSWQETADETERIALQAVLEQWAGRADSALPLSLTSVSEDVLADRRYDPGPFLERMTTPALYLYGSEDINIPASASMARLEELVGMGVPITGHVFPGEGHELGGPSFLPPFYGFADGYAQLIAEFAAQHVTK